MSKPCKTCSVEKELSEFYTHAQMADGHLGICKLCVIARVLAHRKKNIDAIRAYDKLRGKLPHRKRHAAKMTKRWRTEHPGRNAAHNKAQRTHRTAPRCCQMCGLLKRLERHHPDYALPLMIVWLCKPCHAIADVSRRDAEHRALTTGT